MITLDKVEKVEHELVTRLKKKYPDTDVYVYDRGDDLKLDTLIVPKEKRKQGIGTSIMNDFTDYADQHGKRAILSLGSKEKGSTTSSNRLARFYSRFGFVRNRGRHKDFTVSESMIRKPKKIIEKIASRLQMRGYARRQQERETQKQGVDSMWERLRRKMTGSAVVKSYKVIQDGTLIGEVDSPEHFDRLPMFDSWAEHTKVVDENHKTVKEWRINEQIRSG